MPGSVHARSKATSRRETITLAVALDANGAAPSEFRLFTAGWNDTSHGRFLFDAEAARLTLAAFEAHGVDLAIDLEHQMLDGAVADPTARDARGWFRLALKPDGSLYAVNVTWTPDGAQRLAEKRQRYVSPAFTVDPESKRVTKILNCAITAMPATHDTPALVAASETGAPSMTLEEMMKVAEALGLPADATLEDFLAKIGGMKPAEEAPAEEPAEEAPAEELANGAEEDKEEEIAAALSAVVSLSGKPSLVSSVADIRAWHASHVTLAAERADIAKREALLETAERRKGCAELVTLAGRAPATVWADPKSTEPKRYLAAMPIADFREYVADAVKASGRKAPVAPPAGGGTETFATPHGTVTLSASEIRACAEAKADPKEYAANKAAMTARTGR